MKKNFILWTTLLFSFKPILVIDQKTIQIYQDKLQTILKIIKEKSISELINEGTIVSTGIAAGFQTYGYLASYATFKNPYANGAIHYASFKAACLTYTATLLMLKKIKKDKKEDKKNNEKDNNSKKELIDEITTEFILN